MSDTTTPPEPAACSFPCPKCGSPRVRGSKPKTTTEKLLRAAGVHFYRCRECRHHGRRAGPLRGPRRSAPARRAQRQAALRKQATVVLAVAIAMLLGVGAGFFAN